MKKTKLVSLLLAVLMVLSMFTLAGCEQQAAAKLGLGVVIDGSTTDATEEANGDGTYAVVMAAVTVQENGKIAACKIDEVEIVMEFDFEGVCVPTESFASKRELGDNYGMAAWANTTEWYAQVDALEKLIVGKTIDEVNALSGSEEVAKAGCTIYYDGFIAAVNKAYNNATVAGASATDLVSVSYSASVSATDATEEANGKMEADVAFAAVAKNKDGKITAAMNDAATMGVTFDLEGYTEDLTEVQTKREQGDNYGMAAWANTNEWYVQADALDKYVVGKTADEVLGAMDATGTPNADVAKAGCTINVYAAVTALNKAAK